MKFLDYLILYLFFPGLIFCIILSIIVGYIDRKVTARIQYREGPKILQNLYDLLKLCGKEITIPKSSNLIFFISPILSFSSVLLASLIFWTSLIFKTSFIGDIIVLIYLLSIPSIMIVLGSSSTKNIIANLAASREIKLLISYELPLITSLLLPIIKSESLRLTDIIKTSNLTPSYFIAAIVTLFCLHAKAGIVPFDASEAETELAGGVLIEYSGFLLGLIKLTKQMILSLIPAIILAIYFYEKNFFLFIIKYLFFLILIIIIKNTNPRFKIEQSIKFFWFIMFPLSLFSLLIFFWGY